MATPATWLMIPGVRGWLAGTSMSLTSDPAEKAAADDLRMSMDFGNEPLLQAGYTIQGTPTVTPSPTGPTISSVELDYSYQVSAMISGGTAGTDYTITFTITLNDPDSSTVSRSGTLKVY